jgi:hypothetical protein
VPTPPPEVGPLAIRLAPFLVPFNLSVLQGAWSRRIDSEHRLVYLVDEDDLVILQARFHYGR